MRRILIAILAIHLTLAAVWTYPMAFADRYAQINSFRGLYSQEEFRVQYRQEMAFCAGWSLIPFTEFAVPFVTGFAVNGFRWKP